MVQALKIKEPEYQFPETEADDCRGQALGNGHNINYIDTKNQPQSIFIERKFWDDAKMEFEATTEYTLIIRHCPAKINY